MPIFCATSFWVSSRRPSRPKRISTISRSRSGRSRSACRRTQMSTSSSSGRMIMSSSVPRMSESSSSLPSQSMLMGSSRDTSVFWLAVLRMYMRISFSMHREA